MTLESTVICVDNSEFCRNGDFVPTRLLAQRDAANLVARTKMRQNAENACALLTMSNNHLVTTLTTDQNKFMSVMAKVEANGECRFTAAVRVAQLSLKHRMNKNHKQRIVIFVCSPVTEEEKEIIKVAKRLKKEKVNLDIISFGEDEANQVKLAAFINTLNGKDGGTSHLVSIPSGTSLEQALRKSPIIDGGDGGAASGGMDSMDFDPSGDPELAMALRISLEEQRARQQQEGGNESNQNAPETEAQPMDEDQQMLREALTMSMATGAAGGGGASAEPADEVNIGAMTEEEQIAYALQMSMQPEESPAEEATPMATDQASDSQQLVTDPDFLRQVLSNLPDVDPNSDALKEALGEEDKNKDNSDRKK